MKLFEKASKVLEFDRITDALASLASTGGGAEKLRAAVPATEEAGVKKLLDMTEKARLLITVKARPPAVTCKDIHIVHGNTKSAGKFGF